MIRCTRRRLLDHAAAAALALPAAAAFAGCSGSGGRSGTVSTTAGDAPIHSGLEPEHPEFLAVYAWGLYVSERVIAAFERSHGVPVSYQTFESMDEAVATLRRGARLDVVVPATDVVPDLIRDHVIQPLNPAYLTNLEHVWAKLRDPAYDPGSRHTVPYTIWTDGIAWRSDLLGSAPSRRDPYAALWDTRHRGRVAALSEHRDAIALALMRRGERDVNTGDQALLDRASDDLADLAEGQQADFNHLAEDGLSSGRYVVRQSWSGTVAYAARHNPGLPLAYAWPPAIDPALPGVIGNDAVAIPTAAPSPVLAHLFIDHLLSARSARQTLALTGYQPPNRALHPDRLVAEGLVPRTLASLVIREQDLDRGLTLDPLPEEVDRRWRDAYERAVTR